MQSLMDLRTRQPIPPEWDNRPMEERKTTHLTRIVPIDKIDMNLTYPQIRYLDTWGLRWPEYSWRLLSRMLRLNIGSCWISPVPTEDQGASDEKEITYGLTQIKVPDQNSPYVRVQIAAELIWPLLVPEYSQTEKMTASFVIAATLLHEFGHAINHAQYLLMWEPGLYLEPIHFNVTIVDLLQSLRRELFDFVACKGEQFYGDEGEAEHGFVVEKQLLGGLAMNLMSNPMNILSRQIVSLPLMVEMCEWPQAETPVPASRIRKGAIRNPRFPVECYCMPLPIDYMTKFFTQKFWDIDFKRYGQEAFKMLPANRIHKTTMNPVYMRQDILMQAFGKEQWSFVKWVSEFFSANNHRILGEYIRRLLFQALGQHAFVARWLYEVGNWDLAVLAPLNTKVTDLNKAIEEAGTISARHLAPPAAKDQYYFQYVTQHQSLVSTGQVRAGGLMTREQWYERLQSRWTRRVRVGGVLMVGASEVCRLMTAEIAYMERMIFDFFSLNPAARASVRGGGGGGAADQDPIAAARGRMLHCRAWAFQLATWLEELTNVPPLQIAMPFWYQWISRLRYCGKMYHDLLAMLGEEQIDPNDNSWKKRFATVPSSFWKNRVDRIQVLAQKEYLRADPRVRAVVDECLRLISQAKTPNNLNPEFSQPDIQKVTEVINKSIALGKAAPTTVTRNMFKWTYPDQPPPPPPPPATLDQASQEDSTKPQNPTVPNIGGIVFGKPSELGARPPLRLIGSSTKSGSGVERGSKSDNDRDASGALGPAPGGGVKNTGKANKSPSRGVKKNVKSTLNWRGADKSKGFLEGAAKMGVLSTIHELGVPSTTIRGILKSKSSGPTAADSSAPTQTSQASFSFGVAHGDPAPAAPFPSPWADMFTLTADHEYTTKFREEMAAIDVLLNLHGSGPPQPYKTAGPWRETREDSPNDDEPNNLGDPNNGAPPNDGGGPDNGAPPNDGDGPDNGGGNGQPLDGDFGNPQAMDEADLAQLDQEIEDFLQQNTDMTVDNNDNDDI
ncbi:hypothetical protein F5Y06DRAFT_189187 [Hypoxylon sp. FL0890]|nr:hypothetical protein F5Y06DRAFT_189187 [Hypoxylon sp. FL0890]